jgi:MATE family multidrug resistance protein
MPEPEESLPVLYGPTNGTETQSVPPGPPPSVHRQVFQLALPVLAEQVFSFAVGFYDTYLAGHLPGNESVVATAAVGFGAYVSWLANLMFMLASTGTLALVSRARGRGDLAEANVITGRALAVGGVIGLVFAGFMIPYAPYFVSITDLSEEASATAVRYIRVDAFGEIFTAITLAGAAAFRGCGTMRVPLVVLGTVSLVNVVASRALVYGLGPIPRLGVDGIVGGTVVARILGGILMLIMLRANINGLCVRWRDIHFGGEHVGRLARIGLPAALDGLIAWSSHILFIRVISQIGDAAFAAHYVGIQFEAVTYLPATAWGAAAATSIGQSLGAGDRERAVRCGHAAALQCLPVGILGGILFATCATPIYQLMTNSSEILATGVEAMPILAWCQIPLVIGIVYIHGLRGAGETRLPLILAVVSTAGLRTPIAHLCGIVWNGGLPGAWLGMLADVTVRCILGAWLYSRGRWTHLKI